MDRAGLYAYSNLDRVIAVIGFAPIALGLTALLKPLSLAPGMQLQINTPEARKVAEDMYKVYAVRNIAMGTFVVASVYYGHRELMGVGMICAALIATMDGIVAGGNKKGGEWMHLPLVPVVLGLAASCFGYI